MSGTQEITEVEAAEVTLAEILATDWEAEARELSLDSLIEAESAGVVDDLVASGLLMSEGSLDLYVPGPMSWGLAWMENEDNFAA